MAKRTAITFEEAHRAVKNLVKDFEKSESYFLSKDYSEAQVRKDFIDKFFTALGWDVNHNYDKNPYKQEVKIEKPVEVAAAQKRADYAFYLKPDFSNPVFFVEAKKPQKELLNRDFYFQTIRYGWHKQTPIAILTDFEEFHIIDCRYSPDIETALSQKINQFHYKDYEDPEKFAEIYYLFSREAVQGNSINDFAETLPKPKGKSTQKALFGYGLLQAIDETFLKDIEDFRLRIARAMFLTNKNITADVLTEATQSVIDRLVFIRFLEDKLIEPVHYVSNFGAKQSAWFDFIMVSKMFNKKYNGIIFKPKVIDEKDFIPPDDKEFLSVCSDICHINSRFLFNEIPIHIMGTIYERFLGKQIYIENGRIKLDETPAARRAGGVYYTPQFVVDYIVEKTVGKAIKGKSPEEINKLSFIDIACGSGSFLIAVFDKLLRYLHNWYQEHPKKAKEDGCIKKEGLWVLSIRQKQDILRNNIFGIDIDYNAVEVTQLSLALKMLDDETQATAADMDSLYHSAILPDLSNNIKCGNSLIGYNQMFSDKDFETLNPLDFHQAFLTVMSKGGFDCVVGNPPYIQLQKNAGRLGDALKKENYETYERTGDIYTIFIEKALGIINQTGRIGFITSNKWMRAGYGKKLRKFLAARSQPETLIDFAGFKVFKDATVDTNILIASKGAAGANIPACSVKSDFSLAQGLDDYVKNNLDSINKPGEDSWIIANKIELGIRKKIESIGTPLKDWDVKINYGIKTGYNEAFIIDGKKRAELIAADPKSEEIIKPILRGRDIKRYHAEFADLWILFIPWHFPLHKDKTIQGASKKAEKEFERQYPAVYYHLLSHKEKLSKRNKAETGIRYEWYALQRCANTYYEEFEKEKIVWAETDSNLNLAYATAGMYLQKTCFMIIGKDINFIMSILNSKLGQFTIRSIAPNLGSKGMSLTKESVKLIPIPLIQRDKEAQKPFEEAAERIIDAYEKLQGEKSTRKRQLYQNLIDSSSAKIDRMVYKLYGLTEKEIRYIESGV